jgi:hypothetical protein
MPVKYPIAVLAALSAAAAVAVTAARGSDHQDTPEVELSPRMDVNDVYAFEGSSPDRIALAVTTSSPLTPAQTPGASFDPDLLYQIKVDNDGDAIEDLVLQVTFEGSGAGQRVLVRGPAPPQMTGSRTALVDVTPAVSGTVNTVLGSASGMQVFAGPRDDPFFLDLEQFFRIIPDRKPVSGPLSMLPDSATASAFRPTGSAVDYLAGINALAIVIELPESQLTAGGSSRLGIWATISR